MPLLPDPLKELLDLQERMNRLFDETLSRERLEDPALLHGTWVPPADVLETPDGYVLEVEIPGVDRDEVVVQVQGDEVVVRGERRPDEKSRPESFHRLERRYGPFARGFRFPDEIDGDRIRAEFEDGLLRLEVPRAQPRPAARVKVERGG